MALDYRSRIVVEIPNDLKKSFKLYCTMNDVPMTVVLENLIRDYLKEHERTEHEDANG